MIGDLTVLPAEDKRDASFNWQLNDCLSRGQKKRLL